ncbi:MAG: N-acetyl sugar amidotransferase [Rhodospirillales bacterium]|nr:N-acetyl sugar amidotransferase [Rhodospirillales bacterium]
MQPYPRPKNEDISPFTNVAGTKPLPAKYGLPEDVRFCKSCIISNQRPNSAVEYQHDIKSKKSTIYIDENGICDPCRAAHKKQNEIDWDEREKQLIDLCNKFRKNDGSYDCIVPGSGGKDSFYASHVLKYKYGMHPLTVTWAPHIYTDWGWRNFEAWLHSGFDNTLVTPNGRVHRILTRLAIENLFHPFQPFIIGQKAIAPKMSVLHDIPLVFYGENEAEYGNPNADNEVSQRESEYYSVEDEEKLFLSGVSLRDLVRYFDVDRHELQPYIPARVSELEKAQTEVHYLGYYLKWHPQTCYFYAVEHGGFEASPERTPGTYSKYNSIDDKIDDLHYFTTYIKFGIGRATYDAAQEIRSGDINREEGIALVRRYDGEFPERFIDELMNYLSIPEKQFPGASSMFEQPIMDKDYLLHLADRFRSPHLWKYENAAWSLRHTVWQDG